jgi:hypothetical protein
MRKIQTLRFVVTRAADIGELRLAGPRPLGYAIGVAAGDLPIPMLKIDERDPSITRPSENHARHDR